MPRRTAISLLAHTAAVFLAAACSKEVVPPNHFMLVASGSPECLGELAGKMIDGGFGASESPTFQGRHGTIRFGLVDEPRLGAAIQAVKQTACASLDRVEKK
jgi:hypothetical protein